MGNDNVGSSGILPPHISREQVLGHRRMSDSVAPTGPTFRVISIPEGIWYDAAFRDISLADEFWYD